MYGAIIGDIAGSVYTEFLGNKRYDVELFPKVADFTDDSILTIATADVLLNQGDYAQTYRKYGRRFPCPMGGYGIRFNHWLHDDHAPAFYGSWGNGSAMRVGPVGWAMDSLDDVLQEAARSAAWSVTIIRSGSLVRKPRYCGGLSRANRIFKAVHP